MTDSETTKSLAAEIARLTYKKYLTPDQLAEQLSPHIVSMQRRAKADVLLQAARYQEEELKAMRTYPMQLAVSNFASWLRIFADLHLK